jgi:branched-chain amino acid transport system ATP-binding protein
MSEPLIETSEIRLRYGQVQALDRVSIRIDEGESIFVAGVNGAGKTSLLRALSGLERIGHGSIRLAGDEISREPPWRIAARGVAHVPQGRRCFGPLTVEENLRMGAFTNKSGLAAGLEQSYALFPVLRDKRRQRAEELSGGQQQMVAIARAMMAAPRLILLDEPSLGLAPLLVHDVLEALLRIGHEFKTSILIVEQNAKMAVTVGARGYVLRGGRVILEGSSSELEGKLKDAYLGT